VSAERDPGQKRMPLLLVSKLAKSSSSKQETSSLTGLAKTYTETLRRSFCVFALGSASMRSLLWTCSLHSMQSALPLVVLFSPSCPQIDFC